MRINKKDFTNWLNAKHSNWRAVRGSDKSCPLGLYLKDTDPAKYKEFQVDCFDDHYPWVREFIHEVDATMPVGTDIGSKISRKECLEILDEL